MEISKEDLNRRYIVFREIKGAHREEGRLEVIAVMNKEQLIKEEGENFINVFGKGKYLEIKDSRNVKKMLHDLNKKSNRTPLMESIRENFDSKFDYQKIWEAQGYARECSEKFPNYAFLSFPLGKEDFVAGLIYGYFNVIAQE